MGFASVVSVSIDGGPAHVFDPAAPEVCPCGWSLRQEQGHRWAAVELEDLRRHLPTPGADTWSGHVARIIEHRSKLA